MLPIISSFFFGLDSIRFALADISIAVVVAVSEVELLYTSCRPFTSNCMCSDRSPYQLDPLLSLGGNPHSCNSSAGLGCCVCGTACSVSQALDFFNLCVALLCSFRRKTPKKLLMSSMILFVGMWRMDCEDCIKCMYGNYLCACIFRAVKFTSSSRHYP